MTWFLQDGSELTEVPSGKPEGFVYWVHLVEHENINDGYIGVSIDPITRYKSHLRDAFKNKHCNPYFANIIKKYEKDLLVSIIYAGTFEECYTIEFELRQSCNIGWNLNRGGIKPPDRTGIPHSIEHCQNISIGKLGGTRPPVTETTRKRMSDVRKGKPVSLEQREKIRKTLTGIGHTDQRRLNNSKSHMGNIPGNARTVVTPLGEFTSMLLAGKAFNVTGTTILKWIQKEKPGFMFKEIIND